MLTNPYLKIKGDKFSLKAELKRLLAGPQFLLTLLLVALPLALSVAGAMDFAGKIMYETKYHQGDKRKAVWALDCSLLNQKAVAKLCQDKTGNVRIYYWPPFLPLPNNDPLYYGLPFLIAFLSFVGIGNPRVLNIGSELKKIFGLGTDTSEAGANTGPHTDPAKNPLAWLLGGASERKWQSDPGYFFQDTRNLKYYCLYPDMLRTNLLIVAPPGSGKTSSIFRPLIQYLRRIGASAIFFDSKGADFPPELFDLNFELGDQATSIKINLFSGETPAQAGERLGEALIPNLSDDKEYYVNVAKDTCAALVSAHHAVFGFYPTLTQLLLYLSEPESISGLEGRVENLSQSSESDQLEKLRLVAGLKRINSLLTNSKKDTLGSLVTAITPLTTSAASDLLVANPSPGGTESKPEQVFTIEQMLKEPRLVRLSLPVAENPRIAPIIGRIILTQFNFAVLSPNCNKAILKIAAVDEAHNFITASIAKGMAQARSNNAGFMLALQTLSQIPDDSVLDTIFASAGNKLVMAGVGDQDADRFSKTFGELEMPYIAHSKSSGTSHSSNTSSGTTNSYSAGRSTTGGSSSAGGGSTSNTSRSTSRTSNTSSSQQLKLRRLFLASEIRGLPQYHAIIESSDAYGRRYSAMMLDLSQPTVQLLLTKASKAQNKARAKGGSKSEQKEAVAVVETTTTTATATTPASIQSVASPDPSSTFGKLSFRLVTGAAVSSTITTQSAQTRISTSPSPSEADEGEAVAAQNFQRLQKTGFGVKPVPLNQNVGVATPKRPTYFNDAEDEEEDES
jgi:hypothetical protein